MAAKMAIAVMTMYVYSMYWYKGQNKILEYLNTIILLDYSLTPFAVNGDAA